MLPIIVKIKNFLTGKRNEQKEAKPINKSIVPCGGGGCLMGHKCARYVGPSIVGYDVTTTNCVNYIPKEHEENKSSDRYPNIYWRKRK